MSLVRRRPAGDARVVVHVPRVSRGDGRRGARALAAAARPPWTPPETTTRGYPGRGYPGIYPRDAGIPSRGKGEGFTNAHIGNARIGNAHIGNAHIGNAHIGNGNDAANPRDVFDAFLRGAGGRRPRRRRRSRETVPRGRPFLRLRPFALLRVDVVSVGFGAGRSAARVPDGGARPRRIRGGGGAHAARPPERPREAFPALGSGSGLGSGWGSPARSPSPSPVSEVSEVSGDGRRPCVNRLSTRARTRRRVGSRDARARPRGFRGFPRGFRRRASPRRCASPRPCATRFRPRTCPFVGPPPSSLVRLRREAARSLPRVRGAASRRVGALGGRDPFLGKSSRLRVRRGSLRPRRGRCLRR